MSDTIMLASFEGDGMLKNADSSEELAVLETLEKRAALLQEQIAEQLEWMDYIRSHVGPRIEHRYALTIGCFEYAAAQSELDARRAKRRLALARQMLGESGELDTAELEQKLDEELIGWQQEVAGAWRRFQESLDRESGRTLMQGSDSKELSRLYRQIVKRLHPDINPGASEREQQLLMSAMAAYASGDLLTMRAITVVVESLGEHVLRYPEGMNLAEAMELEIAMLEATLDEVRERIIELKLQPPYCFEEKLNNPEWVDETIGELQERTYNNKLTQAEYERRYAELLAKLTECKGVGNWNRIKIKVYLLD
jgi:hypothetical protein